MIDAGTITTYQASTMQSQAHRSLNMMKNQILKPYGLTIMQWVVLGNIYDSGKDGIRTSDLARELSTTLAFVTGTVNLLEAKGFVYRRRSLTDNRSSNIIFEPHHEKQFSKIESDLRQQLRKTIYSKIARDELNTYLTVLHKFSRAS